MYVYIVHAEADKAAADDLQGFLKSRGMVVHTETGERGFAYLQASDVVVGLWSRDGVMARHSMQMVSRMLDAWSDERLVLVNLDHAILPVGMRDLPAIDAGIGNRDLAVWPKVEREAREAINRGLVARQAAEDKARAQARGGGSGSSSRRSRSEAEAEAARLRRAMKKVAAQRAGYSTKENAGIRTPRRSAVKRGPGVFLGILVFIGLVAAMGWAAWEIIGPGNHTGLLHYVALGLGGLAALPFVLVVLYFILKVILAPFRAIARIGRKRRPAPAAASPAPQPVAAEPMADPALFVSYAHLDNAAVEPVVKIVEADGRHVWIDKSITPGDGWAGKIVGAIKSARGVIVMCSPRAFDSDHVRRELHVAMNNKKRLVPIFIEAAQPPDEFEYLLAGVNWLKLYELPEDQRPAAIGKALAAV